MKDPRSRLREQSGNFLNDTIDGILIGFAEVLHKRGDHIDIITTRKANAEIRDLINHYIKQIRETVNDVQKDILKD